MVAVRLIEPTPVYNETQAQTSELLGSRLQYAQNLGLLAKTSQVLLEISRSNQDGVCFFTW
jgi:hypothetical protein